MRSTHTKSEISGRQNHVTAMRRYALFFANSELVRDPCEPHHGTTAADPSIAAVVRYLCFVFQMFQRARFCACIGWGNASVGGFRCSRRNK